MPRRLLLPLLAVCLLTGTALQQASALPIREWANYGSSSSSNSSSARSYPSIVDPFASSSSAASSVAAGTGAVMDPLTAAWTRFDRDRVKRTDGFRAAYLVFRKNETAYLDGMDAFFARRADLRRQCRQDLRKANRDEKFIVVMRCYRAEMVEYRDHLRRQLAYYDTLPGVSQRIRRESLPAQTQLIDAVAAIVYAIDGDVFSTEEELLEAKKNLREKYQRAAWQSLERLRTDHDITWLGHLLLKFGPALEEERAALGEERAAWGGLRICLMQAEMDLRRLVDGTPAARAAELPALRASMRRCAQELQALTPPVTASGAVLPSE